MNQHLFTISVSTSGGPLRIDAFDGGYLDGMARSGSLRIDVEVRRGDDEKLIFPRGAIWCGTPRIGGVPNDGIYARELAMKLVCMKPGDTDEEYFSEYTPEQLEWASKYGEELDMEREAMFCDENGNLRLAAEKQLEQ